MCLADSDAKSILRTSNAAAAGLTGGTKRDGGKARQRSRTVEDKHPQSSRHRARRAPTLPAERWEQMRDDDDAVLDEAIASVQQEQCNGDCEAASTSQMMLQQQHDQVEREISSAAKIKGAQSLLAAKLDEKEQLLKQIEKGQGAAEPWRCVWCEHLNFTHQCGHCRIKKSFGHGPKASKNKLRWLAQGLLERDAPARRRGEG